jgi:hypothetical protein
VLLVLLLPEVDDDPLLEPDDAEVDELFELLPVVEVLPLDEVLLLLLGVVSSPPHPVAAKPATTNAPRTPPTTLNVAPLILRILVSLPL